MSQYFFQAVVTVAFVYMCIFFGFLCVSDIAIWD